MNDVIVRQAVENDIDSLLKFEQGIIAFERPFDPTLQKGKISYYNLREMLHQDHVHIVVAECDGELVGSGYARIEAAKPYLKHKEYAYLGFMFVQPEYRGHGVNQKIIEALKQWTLSKNINEIRLEVYADNSGAIAAYKKSGFKEHLINMRLNISDGG